jgi:HlyD family secretion protein
MLFLKKILLRDGVSMIRRTLLPLIIILALVAVGGGAGTWALLLRPIKVQVSYAERDVPVQVFGLGTVEARVTSKVGFKVSGVLRKLQADVGDRVPQGAVLGSLVSSEQSARVARANAAIEQAEANLQRAKANLEKAQANYANAKSINERRQKLLAGNNTSIEAAETAQAAHDTTLAEVNLAASDVQVARAVIDDAKAQRQLETATLDLHTLTSPYDAMVITRHKELGSALAAGESVFTLIDPKSVWVLAYIDESKSGEIAVGNPAEIVLRSLPGRRFHGRVARIEIESDRVNEERRIQVAFDRLPDDFHLGEQAEVFITAVRLDRAVLVPEAAVSDLNQGRGTVWIVRDRRLEQAEVEIGHRLLDGRVEILKGLPDDAAVAAKLQSAFWAGRSATIAEGKRP